jgi:glycosyltransferase involved in cell wall biosynthesis
MRIIAAHDGGTGCAWYRMIVPLQAVAKHAEGVEVTWRRVAVSTAKVPDPLLQIGDVENADVVVSQRVNAYDGLGMWRRWGSTPALRTVYENDDDVFNITHENTAAYDTYAEGTEVREAVLRYCRTASMLTTTTPYLGDVHRELSGGVPTVVLPNYVPEWVLDLEHDPRDGRLRIGWVGGSSHDRDILEAADAVRRFIKRFPSWQLCVGGVDYRDKFKVKDALFMPWIHVTDEPELYYRVIDFDIGICPLLDTKFSRSKSPVKALEYMARGGVVVASDIEPYRLLVKHGYNGFLVKREHEWLKYLSLLASDEALRLEMKANALKTAAEWTIEKNWQQWVSAYESMFPVGWKYKG